MNRPMCQFIMILVTMLALALAPCVESCAEICETDIEPESIELVASAEQSVSIIPVKIRPGRTSFPPLAERVASDITRLKPVVAPGGHLLSIYCVFRE